MTRTYGNLLLVATCAAVILAVVTDAEAVYLRDESGVSGQEFGAAVAALPDLNGDGRTELLVGSPEANFAGLHSGRAYLWYGGTDVTLDAAYVWDGLGVGRFGWAVATIGDVNHDGVDDFAIGAPQFSQVAANNGRVYIFYGDDPLPGATAQADLILDGQWAGEYFGFSIAAAGDFNSDGRDDLIVGAPFSNRGGSGKGAAYVFYGAPGGPSTTPDLILGGPTAFDHFGWSVAAAGDFADGVTPTVVVGAPANDVGAGTRAGRAFVFEGSNSPSPGPDTVADFTLASTFTGAANDEFGYSVCGLGDWNGDGQDDLAVGAPYSNAGALDAGRIQLYFGGPTADEDPDRVIDGAASGDAFGFSVAGPGDVTGTILKDLLIGAPFSNADGADAGRAYLYGGGSGRVGSAGALPVVDHGTPVQGTVAEDRFGFWVSPGGDFDGDTFDDLAVGAPSGNVSQVATAGWVRLVDSSGTSVPLMLSGWRAVWLPDGSGVEATLSAGFAVSAVADLTWSRVVRDPAGASRSRAVITTGPVNGAPLTVDGTRWTLRDADAALAVTGQTSLVYDLEVTLTDGSTIVLTELEGPRGAPPIIPVALSAAAPNPFNPRTTLRFRAPVGTAAVCCVVDLRGQEVACLHAGFATGAWQTVTWGGRTTAGRPASAGVYIVRLEAGGHVQSQRVVLTK